MIEILFPIQFFCHASFGHFEKEEKTGNCAISVALTFKIKMMVNLNIFILVGLRVAEI